jgi:tetratricopeptide (TPR) repeat protein
VARNDYAGAHAHYADVVNELIDYVGLDVGVSRVLILRAGAVEQQFKKFDLAEKYFQTALKQPLPKSLPKSFPVYAWNHIADCYEHHGQWVDAIRIRRISVDQASKLDSPSKKLLVNCLISLCGTCGNFQNYSDAVKYIDQAITLIEKQADSAKKRECKASAYAWRGYLNLAVNKYQDAVDDLNIAISQNKGSDWSYFYRGRALQILGRYDLALADYNKAVTINPSAALERYRRGQTLAALGKHTEAIADFSQAEKLGGKDECVQDLDSNSKSRSNLITSSALSAQKAEEIIKLK